MSTAAASPEDEKNLFADIERLKRENSNLEEELRSLDAVSEIELTIKHYSDDYILEVISAVESEIEKDRWITAYAKTKKITKVSYEKN